MATSDGSRVEDFDVAMKFMESEDYDRAIANFQECMKKLSSKGLGLSSDLFPKCLQNIANCYSKKDDMENALCFKKFEKLYYETVLLHNGVEGLLMKADTEDQKEQNGRDRGDGSSEASTDSVGMSNANGDINSVSEVNQTVKRASEYEQLARLCLQQECVSLALEYGGKATLLYRHEFGDEHEDTKKSFELFTSIYAEAGKQQYSESMNMIQLDPPKSLDLTSPKDVQDTLLRHRNNVSRDNKDETQSKQMPRPLKRTRSILKKTTSVNGKASSPDLPTPETPTRKVTFADPLPQMVRLRDDDETDDSSTNLLLFFLICILIILISLLLSALICHMYPSIGACVEFRREFTYYYTRLRMLYRGFFRK